VSGPGQSRYSALVDAANEAAEEVRAKPIGGIELAQRVRLAVDLDPIHALQLARLAEQCNMTPADLVVQAVKDLLAGVPRGAR
jgi:hypothetical protein